MHQLPSGAVDVEAFVSIQNSLLKSTKLAFPKNKKIVCVCPDASKEFWAGGIAQTSENQLQQKKQNQKNEPRVFLGGTFVDAQGNWTRYEKEAYTIVQAFKQMNYLQFSAQPVHVFTDHRNLRYVFVPIAIRPKSPGRVLSKVHRWAIDMSRFEFVTDHIERKITFLQIY